SAVQNLTKSGDCHRTERPRTRRIEPNIKSPPVVQGGTLRAFSPLPTCASGVNGQRAFSSSERTSTHPATTTIPTGTTRSYVITPAKARPRGPQLPGNPDTNDMQPLAVNSGLRPSHRLLSRLTNNHVPATMNTTNIAAITARLSRTGSSTTLSR